jgi:uncharacterized protein YbaA (DUF1428 family)
MAQSVDAFVLTVPTDKLDEYPALAERGRTVWREHGALQSVEAVADDVKPGKLTSFPQSVMAEEGETVIFAYVVYKSREHRDEVLGKVMADPRMKEMEQAGMPFDGKRMFWGGFRTIVQSS